MTSNLCASSRYFVGTGTFNDKLFGGDWLYELKFDGYGALSFKAGKEVRLISFALAARVKRG